MPRHDRTLGLAVALAVLIHGIPASAQSECDEDAEIIGGGGSAGLDCPASGAGTPEGPSLVAGTPSEGCADEQRIDPERWWLSYDVPGGVIDAWFEHQAVVAWPEGMTVGVLRDCSGDIRSAVRWVPEPEPGSAGDGEGLFAVRERARAAVTPDLPSPRVSPSETVVGVETWLWVDDSYWQAGVATDATPSGQVVEVAARPREVIWDLDEGSRTCVGPGIPWSETAQAAFESQSPLSRGNGNPACTYVFVHSSTTQSDDVYEASVTVVWEFSWSVGGLDRGVFGSVELTESWPLRVGEVQALITG